MVEIDVPGYKTFRLRHLILDVNGTLALDGALLPGITERLAALKGDLEVHLITADTHGRQKEVDRQLDLVAVILPPPSLAGSQREAKEAFVRELGAEGVVAMGNGNNDAGMVKAAGLGIAVLGPEGLTRSVRASTMRSICCCIRIG
jgi:soluble P-type ATPase